MLRLILALSVLLLLSIPTVGQDEQREAALLASKVNMEMQDGDPAAALTLAREFVSKYFGSLHSKYVLMIVAKIRIQEVELAGTADEILREALNGSLLGRLSGQAQAMVEGSRAWSFSRGEMGPKSLE
jgi:hypothetical protein